MVGHDLSKDDVNKWTQSDANDGGYGRLNDTEIVESVVDEVDDDSGSEDDDESQHDKISDGVAVCMFDKCLQWLQEQDEASSYNIRTLQELREMAARKRLSAIKQKKISDYFSITPSSPTTCISTYDTSDTSDHECDHDDTVL